MFLPVSTEWPNAYNKSHTSHINTHTKGPRTQKEQLSWLNAETNCRSAVRCIFSNALFAHTDSNTRDATACRSLWIQPWKHTGTTQHYSRTEKCFFAASLCCIGSVAARHSSYWLLTVDWLLMCNIYLTGWSIFTLFTVFIASSSDVKDVIAMYLCNDRKIFSYKSSTTWQRFNLMCSKCPLMGESNYLATGNLALCDSFIKQDGWNRAEYGDDMLNASMQANDKRQERACHFKFVCVKEV